MAWRPILSRGFRAFSICSVVVLSAACGGNDDGNGDFGKDVQGVYAIETWTKNESACDVEGADVLATETDKKLGIRRDEFLIPFVVIATCADLDDCASATAGSIFTALGGGAALDKKTASGYASSTGTMIWTHTPTGCTGGLEDAVLTKLGGGRIEFRRETYKFENVPFDTKDDEGDDECSADTLRKAAKDGGCTALEVITAAREADIPPKPSS
jgi:hypothetical protein